MFSLADASNTVIRQLEWDMHHFGFPVAEIACADLTDDQLSAALNIARRDGVQLVYWSAFADRMLNRELLEEFDGRPVNHRVRFLTQLTNTPPPCGRMQDPPYAVRIFPRCQVPRTLLDLAVVAGGHSRFYVDSRIPSEKFRELYEIWMTRSVLRELADTVLVAAPEANSNEIVGTITLSQTAGAGQIGLLAVREDHRGQGVGTRLMAAAHEWLRERGVAEVNVVTQLENREACGLYSRWGYKIAEVRQMFHFWPQRRVT